MRNTFEDDLAGKPAQPERQKFVCVAHGCPMVGAIEVDGQFWCGAHVHEPAEHWQAITQVLRAYADVLKDSRDLMSLGIGDPRAPILTHRVLERVGSILNDAERDRIEKAKRAPFVVGYCAELSVRRASKRRADAFKGDSAPQVATKPQKRHSDPFRSLPEALEGQGKRWWDAL